MNSTTLTFRLDAKLKKQLAQISAESGRSRSELVRDAIRGRVERDGFERVRDALLPLGEAAGLLTDEDVFRSIS